MAIQDQQAGYVPSKSLNLFGKIVRKSEMIFELESHENAIFPRSNEQLALKRLHVQAPMFLMADRMQISGFQAVPSISNRILAPLTKKEVGIVVPIQRWFQSLSSAVP